MNRKSLIISRRLILEGPSTHFGIDKTGGEVRLCGRGYLEWLRTLTSFSFSALSRSLGSDSFLPSVQCSIIILLLLLLLLQIPYTNRNPTFFPSIVCPCHTHPRLIFTLHYTTGICIGIGSTQGLERNQ
jgi:hypothetical protein